MRSHRIFGLHLGRGRYWDQRKQPTEAVFGGKNPEPRSAIPDSAPFSISFQQRSSAMMVFALAVQAEILPIHAAL